MKNGATFDFGYTFEFESDLAGLDSSALARYVDDNIYLWVACMDEP